MNEIKWSRIKNLLSGNPSVTLQWMEELEHCEGWRHIVGLLEREAKSMRERAASTGIDPTGTGQVFNHNRNVFTSAGLLSVRGLVREIKSQAAAVLKERPDVAR